MTSFRADAGRPRRTRFAAAAAVLLVAIAPARSAGSATAPAPATASVRVAATTEDLAALAREVGGDRVRALTIGRVAAGSRAIEPVAGGAGTLESADVFVENGLALEASAWKALIAAARNERLVPGEPSFVDASANLVAIEVPDSASRTSGDVHALGNPHFLLDPLNGANVAHRLRDAFVVVDPDGTDEYRRRCAEFESRLGRAMVRWQARARAMGLAGLDVVTYHRTWSYFARAFGFRVVDTVEPAPGAAPSPERVRELAGSMRTRKVGLLLASAEDDTAMCARIAREAGVPLAVAPANLAEAKGATSEFDLFDRVFDALAAALRPAARH